MTEFAILAPSVQAILRDAASRVLAFDPDLAADLADMAAEYAGPYVEAAVNPNVSDEEWQQQRRDLA